MSAIEQIFLDMDGVLTDFVGAALCLHNRKDFDLMSEWPKGSRDISAVLGISKSEFWRVVDDQGAEFWSGLAAFEWSENLVDLVRQFAPMTILTSPSLSPSCFEGKVQWLYDFFPKANGRRFSDFLIGRPKELLAGPRRVLIDDSESNVDAFRAAGGHAILFPQPWNATYAIEDRLGYLRAQLGLLGQAIEAIDTDTGPWSARTLSLVSQSMMGEPFQVSEFIGLGSECAVFRLTEGNILKIAKDQVCLPELHRLDLPVVDQGYVKVVGSEYPSELFWFIQPFAKTPIDTQDFESFLGELRKDALSMTDPSLHNLGYFQGEVRILDPWSVVRH